MRIHILVALAVVLLLASCSSTRKNGAQPLDQSDALALAVKVANDECMRRFGESPFVGSEYAIRFHEDRWTWGRLDIAGPAGFSALVSFDARGNNRTVEAFFSTDKVSPLRSNRDDN